MLDTIFNIGATLTGLGLIGWVILSFFAPSIAGVAGEWLKALSPIVNMFARGVSEFGRILYKGLRDVVDSAATVTFVVVVALASYGFAYYKHSGGKEEYYEQRLGELRKDYRFTKRTPADKRRYLRTLGNDGKSRTWWTVPTSTELHKQLFGK